MKAVVWTDTLQTVVMIGSFLFITIKSNIDVGGTKRVLDLNWETDRVEFMK